MVFGPTCRSQFDRVYRAFHERLVRPKDFNLENPKSVSVELRRHASPFARRDSVM